ncbi:molybdopterin-dependent oxidoreductase [Oerskovia sp. Sa1BUA8]|uniref:Molybdopterin-dependent oxidoreductase n=1 Tax=Oerskovia douganii TaxID=2762210 RepID=A0A9D5Z120_9CELL|nr:molybdopterin-dependent oxidoreductase [Oerskovia douganii]MBE7701754.1 molybdopterin-dependent oxidoreductase [Oerskovia douganii]
MSPTAEPTPPGTPGTPGTPGRGSGAARTGPSRLWAPLLGIVSALGAFAVAELVALVVGAGSSPVLVVGAGVVDRVPPWLKDFAVETFGTADKTVLILGIVVVLALAAVAAGTLETRRPPWGAVLLVAVGLVGVAAAVTRPDATPLWALPTVVGVGVGVMLLRTGAARLRTWRSAALAATTGPADPETPLTAARRREAVDRRSFLVFAGLTTATAIVVGGVSRVLSASARAVTAARDAIRLPAPTGPAVVVPAGADLAVPGITPYVTPNDDFYRIDTALRVPEVNPDDWRLRVVGLVEEEVELTFAELLALPLVEHATTLTCVSNEVGGNLVGNAVWLGYPLRDLLARARPHADADMVLSRSADGWTASTPLDVLTDPGRESLLAVGMNGEPLPLAHGFPVRMVVPGLYGYVSATKWVVELKVTRFADDVAYWSTRGWSERGPIKTSSRIDVPRAGATVSPGAAGDVVVAGVAWSQHTGVAGVEVRVDEGEWEQAELAATVSADTWRQWTWTWASPAAGSHRLAVRATDTDGTVQTSTEAPPAPDGSSGWDAIEVRVG